jgi:hypothetical protein
MTDCIAATSYIQAIIVTAHLPKKSELLQKKIQAIIVTDYSKATNTAN